MILQSLAGLPAFLVYFIVKIPVPNLSARIAAGEMASAIGLDCRRWRRARSTRRR
jgi:putative membrane protein